MVNEASQQDASAFLGRAAASAVSDFASSAPGVTNVIELAVRYATVDDRSRENVLDVGAFLCGLYAEGVATTVANSASWFAEVVGARLGPNASPAGLTPSAPNPDYPVVASVSLRWIGRRAVDFARETVSRDKADLRHLMAAWLAEDDASVRSALSALDPRLAGLDPAHLRARLYEGIAADPEPAERSRMDVWERILMLSGGVPPRRPDEVPRFASDRPGRGGSDPLGIRPDVVAFARLICLEDVTPPLSIGLFGGWGSGKSTFMEALEAEIDAIAEAPVPAERPGPRFVRNVVQIRFNAWHYADANLWASLTAEFFDQLRAGGYRQTGRAVHARLVEQVNALVHRLAGEAEASRKAVAEGNAQVRAALKARDAAAASVEAGGGAAFRQTLVDSVTEAYEARRGDLAALGVLPGVESFLEVAGEARSLSGKIAVVWRYLREHPGRGLVALAGGVAVGAAALAPLAWTAAPAASVVSALGGAAALWGATAPARAALARILDSTAAFAGQIEGARRADLAALASAEEALHAAEAEAAARQAAAERAGRALARYVDPSPKLANPPRLLRYMLEDDPDARALEREVGLISRTRRLFQAVDEIVRDERGKDAALRDPEVPERIVIYIDDLDRCTAPQVYAVLQAIHLLLAFELFVVVVGVDVGWVQKALAQEIKVEEADRSEIASHYLEKIFQLPYWLRPLEAGGADGGSYGRLVTELLAADVVRAEPPPGAEPPTPDEGAPPEAGPTPEVPPTDGPTEAEEEPADALVTMALTEPELAFLASPELGAIAPKDPRAVKRMLNTYRVIRGRLGAEERAAFLGEGGGTPAFQLIALLLALEGRRGGTMHEVLEVEFSAGEMKKAEAHDPGIERALAASGWNSTEPDLILPWARMVERFSFSPPAAARHHVP